MDQTTVVKISSALSNKPFYIKVDQPDLSIDRIITESISTLRNSGKPLQSQQLQQLYASHQIYNDMNLVEKGSLLSELANTTHEVEGQEVQVYELNLITSHSGG